MQIECYLCWQWLWQLARYHLVYSSLHCPTYCLYGCSFWRGCSCRLEIQYHHLVHQTQNLLHYHWRLSLLQCSRHFYTGILAQRHIHNQGQWARPRLPSMPPRMAKWRRIKRRHRRSLRFACELIHVKMKTYHESEMEDKNEKKNVQMRSSCRGIIQCS